MEGFMNKQFKQRVQWVIQSVVVMLVAGVLIIGCASTDDDGNVKYQPLPKDLEPTNSVPNAGGGGLAGFEPKGDRLQVGDQVTVKFSGTTDQSLQEHVERIKEDGTITLPHILEVKAVGKTLGELQKHIHDRYVPDYYKRLTVTVTGEQRVYYVGGQVKNPGRQVYLGATTVTKAIQSASDFTDFAAKRRVKLTRSDGKTVTIDCKKAAADPSLDLPVYPNDKIEVPMRGPLDLFD